MTSIMLASIGVALLSLIFSAVPFVQLIYIFSAQYAVTWEEWTQITVIMLIASYGATIYRKIRK